MVPDWKGLKAERWERVACSADEAYEVPCDVCGDDLRGRVHLESAGYAANACSNACASHVERYHSYCITWPAKRNNHRQPIG